MAVTLALSDRIFSCDRSKSLYASRAVCGGRPHKYKGYDKSKLEKAVLDVSSGVLSTRRAALEYGIPQSTLSDNVRGRVCPGTLSGRKKYLSDIEEEELVAFITNAAEIGYAYTVKEIMFLVQEVIDQKGIQSNLSHGWWEGFKARHPSIVRRRPEPVTALRSQCAQPSVLQKYFDLLECTLKDNNLTDRPAQIFNMDETGMPLDPKAPYIVCSRGQKHPSFMNAGSKVQITVLSCCSAAGYTIPPFVIFDRKSLKAELTIGEVPGTMYGLSESGWVDSELFHLWFENHFLVYAPAARPLLLIMDGHSSHYNPDTIHKAAEERVIVFCLPPNTTHRTQPLDKGCFSPLKSHWKYECSAYLKANPGKVVTRYQFSELFGKAWVKGMTMKNIIGGFKVTGIYPFNPEALLPKSSSPIPSRFCDLSARTGLKFIPLFSPLPSRYKTRDEVNDTDPIVPTVDDSFTQEEIALFSRRFEEGYDIFDERYEEWKRRNQISSTNCPSPDVSLVAESNTLPHHTKLFRRLMQEPPSVSQGKTSQAKTSARVLTSQESIQMLNEKRKKKNEEAAEKEKRKQEREERKRAKQG